MAYILNIDTSTELCSVSVSFENTLLHSIEIKNEQFVHAEKLHLLIQEVLKVSGVQIDKLSAVGISIGPGSYTGLRIGVSSVKGLAYGLNIPIISVPTLASLTNGLINSSLKKWYCPMIDARRMEVYCCLYDENFQLISPYEAKIVDEVFYKEYSKQSILYFGTGAEKVQAILSSNFHYVSHQECTSKNMVTLAYAKYLKKDFDEISSLEPLYLKEFLAGAPKSVFGT